MNASARPAANRGKPPKRSEKTVVAGGTSTNWVRLEHLYRITKLLVRFDDTNQTLSEILAVVSQLSRFAPQYCSTRPMSISSTSPGVGRERLKRI